MKNSILKLLFFISIFTIGAFTNIEENSQYKCMIQMTNYTGEGAYVIISLIDPQGDYEKTLYVQGEDNEWYHDINKWWSFHENKKENIDAITGATIGGGERVVSVIEIDDSKINAGYKIRFETAVEEKEYYVKDVEFLLTSETVKSKIEGTGHIRYVRMLPN